MKVAIVLNSPEKIKKVVENDVIYTDGGYKNRKYLKGKNTVALVGDFDTLEKIPKGVNIVKLDRIKDFTDGEKAVRYAKEIGTESITIYGATGGKTEHVLGNIALLKIAKEICLPARIVDGSNAVELLGEGRYEFKTEKDKKVSFIPYGGDCEFTVSFGLYYPLNGIKLTTADTLGISNVATSDSFSVEIKSGEALVIY